MSTPTADIIRQATFTERSKAQHNITPVTSWRGIMLATATTDQLRQVIEEVNIYWTLEARGAYYDGYHNGRTEAQAEASLANSKERIRLRAQYNFRLGLVLAIASLVYLAVLTVASNWCPL